MLLRILEPEAMDTAQEANEYDAMDHAGVNARFVADFLAFHGPCRGGNLLDVGTGTARIPIQLARADDEAMIVAVDLAHHMLRIAARNVAVANLEAQIQLEHVDAKGLPYPDRSFEGVISNTIIHHIPRPEVVIADLARLVESKGSLFIRDLVRPDDELQVLALVERYAASESASARALFGDSLRASLTLEEIRGMVAATGLSPKDVNMTSDRHWTWAWRRD